MINNNASQRECEIPLNVLSDDNQDNIDEFLLKVYEKHIDAISLYAKTIQIAQMIAYISAVISMIILAIRLCPFSSFYYSYTLIPGLIGIFALMITLNIFLLMKDLIDSMQKNQQSSGINPGTVISYLCLNIIGLSTAIFISLIFVKLDSMIKSEWMSIFIPLFLSCCTALFFIIFITPAFFEKKLFFEIALMFIDSICVFAFGLLFSVKKDINSSYSYGVITIPAHISLGLHSISIIISLAMKRKANIISSILTLISLMLFFLTLLLFQFKQDNIVTNNHNWVEVVLGLTGFLCLFAESIYSLFFEQDSTNY